MALSPEAAQKLIGAINANAIVNYVSIAAIACAMVDYCEMLPREVEHMWYSHLSVPKVLFLTLRYYTFVHVGLSSDYHGGKANSGVACNPVFYRDGFSSLVIHTLCEAISYARVYAFAGRQTPMLVFLSVLFVAFTVAEFWFLAIYTKTVEFAPLPPELGIGCIPIKGNNIWLSIIFKLILSSLIIVTLIMMYIAYKRRSNSRGTRGLVRVFYRDGIFYFITLSALAISNIIFDHVAPPNGLQFTMVQAQVYLNSLLTSRMLIHLRECAQKDVQLSSYSSRQRKIRATALAELEWRAKDGEVSYPRAPVVLVSVNSESLSYS